MSIYFMEQSFNHIKTNPFQNDLPYTNEWIMLRLLETADFKLFTGGGVDGIFQLVITKDNIDWAYKVFDFIQYESESDKNIIATPDIIGISENTTPRIFAEKADQVFQEKFGIELNNDTWS